MKNESAFPTQQGDCRNGVNLEGGLTKLEYFAGLAMQGVIAHKFDEDGENCEGTVADAIEYAKELIKQLKDVQ